MAEDGFRARAATFIDDRHQDERYNLILEHRRQEQRILAFHKGQLQSFTRNREVAELRYAQRFKTDIKAHYLFSSGPTEISNTQRNLLIDRPYASSYTF